MQRLKSNKLRPPELDARLAAAAAYVRQGCTAADIGCDHGRLSVALAAAGKCRKIIASDIRPAPLAAAQKLVALHNCGSVVECRLGAGLFVLDPGEAEDVIIAGVSGVTTAEIMRDAPEGFYDAGKHQHFILVPATKHPFLRRYLAQNGFSLLDETPVSAGGKYYTVMLAEYTGIPEQHDDLWNIIGKADHGKDAAGYLRHAAVLLKKEANSADEDGRRHLLMLAGKTEEAADHAGTETAL